MTPPKVPRLQSLDALRALAILLVLFRHLPQRLPRTASPAVDAALAVLHRGGWAGVDLFFVLSGFLISGLLFREQQRHGAISFKRFFVRRGFRIYPPFYTYLAVAIAVDALLGIPTSARAVVGELFYLQNYVGRMWSHTWSLAVEEHFYLLLPLLLLVLGKTARGSRPFRLIPAVFVLLAGVCLALRLRLVDLPFDDDTHVFPTHLRIDSLFVGVLLSYLHHERPELLRPWFSARRRGVLLGLGAALVSPVFLVPLETTPWIRTVGFSLVSLGFGAILLAALGTELSGRGWRALGVVGVHSYSIYLWHIPIGLATTALATRALPGYPTEAWFGAYLVTSLLGGILLAKAIELPLIRVRDRRFPRREGALEPATRRPAEDGA